MIDKLLIIPDTQVRKGVCIDHIKAAGNYIAEHKPDVVVHLGDHYDMPSLNRYASKKEIEGQRIKDDIEAGNKAITTLFKPLHDLQKKQRRDKKKVYKPRLVYLNGNHDPSVRLPRLYEEMPVLEGMIQEPDLIKLGFTEVHEFLDILDIEGIKFSHYFVNPHSARKAPLGGTMDTMLKNCGFSFVQGHTQTYKCGKHYLTDGTQRLGIVAGAFYLHDEGYMGKQGNKSHWRGIIQLNEVSDGGADVCELSINYLLRNYL